jgi:hypothetical protein
MPPNHSLPLMLEAVEELLELLETQKSLLEAGRELPEALLDRLRLASASVGEVAARMRRDPPPTPGPEARALKATLEKHFVRAFSLTRENERRLKGATAGRTRVLAAAPSAGARGTPGEIERRYRERMRRPGASATHAV